MNDAERREIEQERARLVAEYRAAEAVLDPRGRHVPAAVKAMRELRARVARIDQAIAKADADAPYEGLNDDDLAAHERELAERLEDATFAHDAVEGRLRPARKARLERERRELVGELALVRDAARRRRQDAAIESALGLQAEKLARANFDADRAKLQREVDAVAKDFREGKGSPWAAQKIQAASVKLAAMTRDPDAALAPYKEAAAEQANAKLEEGAIAYLAHAPSVNLGDDGDDGDG